MIRKIIRKLREIWNIIDVEMRFLLVHNPYCWDTWDALPVIVGLYIIAFAALRFFET